MNDIDKILGDLEASGNLRMIPPESAAEVVDFSGNDYLGLGTDESLRQRFFAENDPRGLLMSASASRLLAASQKDFDHFESLLAESYGAPALLFNSGYHANTGLVSALGSVPGTLIVADKLVHASIIDGIRLSGAPFERFRHNDMAHLRRIIENKGSKFSHILIIVESIYSMDGDRAPLAEIARIKRSTPGAMLYVDEAHGVGVEGPAGLGLAYASGVQADVDVLVGTLGKALASSGAYAILRGRLRDFMVNKARSLIFSTALPPAIVRWSAMMWRESLAADWRRERLAQLSRLMAEAIPGGAPSHIRPLIVGDARRAVELSKTLLEEGFKVLPIRTPTVPPGTERLRFSLSASISNDEIHRLAATIRSLENAV